MLLPCNLVAHSADQNKFLKMTRISRTQNSGRVVLAEHKCSNCSTCSAEGAESVYWVLAF